MDYMCSTDLFVSLTPLYADPWLSNHVVICCLAKRLGEKAG